MKTAILCGGRGTRLREITEAIPKVLVEVGGKPILWHIMKWYAASGVSDFVLALGYKGDQVEERIGRDAEPGWSITYVDTGPDAETGERLKRLGPYLEGPEPFFVTYGDGLADIDLGALLNFHRGHGRVASVTVVHPLLQFGLIDLGADGAVTRFREKPRLKDWVNGGFFVFNSQVFDYVRDGAVLEREPLAELTRDSQLMAYRHEGFWACMDTYKDNEQLNAIWADGAAPWRVWDGDGR